MTLGRRRHELSGCLLGEKYRGREIDVKETRSAIVGDVQTEHEPLLFRSE